MEGITKKLELLKQYHVNVLVTLLDGLEKENLYLYENIKMLQNLRNELDSILDKDTKEDIDFLINWYK